MKQIIVLILLSLAICCGCEKNDVSEHESAAVSINANDTASWSSSHDTAPMPEKVVEEEDLVGYWSPNPEEGEPDVIEFYKEDGILKYRYFSVLLGNGNGFGIGKERTIFEYNAGNVVLRGNQGSCSCQIGESERAYISFYCMDPDMETIADQKDGTVFYRWEEFTMPE
ncbi:hypothetical protein [Hominisplanchenecus murintestinalis]|uniref:hypothetical protein n=1 Tax=Hominisplanchenecus murintestinalis TaxID=2941517 RepID=UPI0020419D18|nr:hypothetical protein [Hominisplanchenecus murintestinalis]